MIVLAAVCPGAPLLVPGLAPSLASTVQRLVQSCGAAVASLAGVDRILLLTSGPRSRDLGPAINRGPTVHPPGTALSSALLTDSRRPGEFTGALVLGPLDDSPVQQAAGPAQNIPGVGVVVGAALLAAAGVDACTTAIELADSADRVERIQVGDTQVSDVQVGDIRVRDLLTDARTSIDRVGLLVVAEGSGSRGSDSPGGGHPGATGFDAGLAAALADGDPTALLAAVAGNGATDASMVFTSRAVFVALADLTRPSPPHRSELLYNEAPLGVGYLVARWSWDSVIPRCS